MSGSHSTSNILPVEDARFRSVAVGSTVVDKSEHPRDVMEEHRSAAVEEFASRVLTVLYCCSGLFRRHFTNIDMRETLLGHTFAGMCRTAIQRLTYGTSCTKNITSEFHLLKGSRRVSIRVSVWRNQISSERAQYLPS